MHIESINDYLKNNEWNLVNKPPAKLEVHPSAAKIMTKTNKVLSVQDHIVLAKGAGKIVAIAAPKAGGYMGVLINVGENQLEYVSPDRLQRAEVNNI